MQFLDQIGKPLKEAGVARQSPLLSVALAGDLLLAPRIYQERRQLSNNLRPGLRMENTKNRQVSRTRRPIWGHAHATSSGD